jgi:dTDP-4-amino-4,6-dideoxygalactose transaminase
MIEFNDLKPAHTELAQELKAALERVLASGCFILGPEVEAFEQEFASYHGVRNAVAVATGTDAIELALRAARVGPGDEVITVAHTAVATVCAIERAGAKPVLVDIDPNTYTMHPGAAAAAITPRTRAVIPVHLYGHPANLDALTALTERHDLLLIEDCAQAHGARWNGRLVGTFGALGCFSFYPTKNLGALGDGGAVITRDEYLADRLRRLRNYGQVERYHHDERGINSRLDEIQAACLRVKLAHLDDHNAARRRIAEDYHHHLRGVIIPEEHGPVTHVYHLYVVRHRERDRLSQRLRQKGIGTLVHYPIPIHQQPAYEDLEYGPGSLPHTERAATEVLSLPLYVGLTSADVLNVAEAIYRSLREAA